MKNWFEGLKEAEQFIKDGYSHSWIEQEFWYEEESDCKQDVFDYLAFFEKCLTFDQLPESLQKKLK